MQKKVKSSISLRILNYFFLISLLFGYQSIRAKQEEVILLSRKVGITIDAEEKEILGLFPDIGGFQSAQFYKIDDEKYYGKIVYLDHTRSRTLKRYYSWKQLQRMKYSITSYPEITEEMRANHRYKLSYLRVHEMLEQIPNSTFCRIRHANGRKISGTFITYQDRNIFFQSPTKKIQIPITEIESIVFRPYIDTRNPMKKAISFTIGAVVGLGLGEIWNLQSGPDVDITWHNRFTGTALGLVFGSELFKAISILTSPKEKIAFTPEEVAKLK